ncbi:MAG TPA: PilZ domain-containing protein [Allosphingosinicella sp.]|jgi:hypothetical protein
MNSEGGPGGQFKPRNSGRTPVEGRTRLRAQSWYSIEVTVCDVSTTGFNAQCPETVRIGSYVSLDVPGIGPVNAQVRWQLGERMGGQFLDPISLNRCDWTAAPVDPPQRAA